MALLRRRKPASAASRRDAITLFHAADIHGADLCWRKFLGARKAYGAQALILGGDLTGKAIVPIVEDAAGHYSTTMLGEQRIAETERERRELLDAVRFNGMYPWVATPAEIAEKRDSADLREELFDQIILDDLERWLKLADDRLSDTETPLLLMGGNDDPWQVDDVLAAADSVTSCDGKITEIAGHEVLSFGYSNVTPWRTERELEEDELYERLSSLAGRLREPSNAIFNIHVPPKDTGIDTACEIKDNLEPVFHNGQPNLIGVGSSAVRRVIEEVQPLLSLHGHIHESSGAARIGNTVCLNPGSEYNSGRLKGVLVTIEPNRVRGHQFITG